MEDSKKKTSKVWLIIIVIILMIIAFCLGLFLSNILCKKCDDKKDQEIVETKKEELSAKGIKNVMERFEAIKISSDRLYENDKFEISQINLNEMLVTALSRQDIPSVCANEGDYVVLLSEINEELERYIGKTVTTDDIKKVKEVSMGNPYDYHYSIKATDNIRFDVKNFVCGGEFDADDYVYGNIIKGERVGDYVYIYEKKAFGSYDQKSLEKDIFKVNYYTDYKKTGKIVETLDSMEFRDKDGNIKPTAIPNWDLYNTYKYTFKLIDGAYYFQSFELVK